jgi:MYXO-CTERM domain-containing protein
VAPGLYLSFAGTRRDYPLVEIPITVADELVDVIFDDHATHVPLPDIRMSGTSYDLGEVPVGESSERTLTIDNVGEAELEVTLAMPGSPFGVDEPSLTLAPGAEESFTVTFAPETGGVANGVVLLRTNDPDESTVAVRLTGSGIETTMPMDDGGTPMDDGGMPMDDGGAMMVPEDGGCGCRSAGAGDGARGWPLFAVLALLAPLRRRR